MMKPIIIPTDEFSDMKYWKLQDLIIITFKKTNWSTRERRFSNDDNEDSISIDLELGKQHSQSKGFYFFGVYDGHGVNGADKVSNTCSTILPKHIAKSLPRFWSCSEKSVKNAIKKGFKKTEKYMKSELPKESKDAGCTAIIAVMTPLKDLYVAYIGDSPGFITTTQGLSVPIIKEHDLHNKGEILRLRAQKSYGLKFSIYRLAPGRIEKFWALDNTFSRGMQYTRSFGDFYIKDKAKNSLIAEPDFANKIYNAKDLNLLVLCSDGITNRLRVYRRMPTQVILSYMKQHKNSPNPLELACKDLVKLCDLISQSGYCVDDMSIIIIAFLNGKTAEKWYEDVTKDVEDPRDWLNPAFREDDDLSDISEQDLGDVESPVKDSGFDIYDTSNQYSAEEAEEFADMTVPDL